MTKQYFLSQSDNGEKSKVFTQYNQIKSNIWLLGYIDKGKLVNLLIIGQLVAYLLVS